MQLHACSHDNEAVILGLVHKLEASPVSVGMQLAALQPLSSLFYFDRAYDHSLIHRVMDVAFEVMHTQLQQFVLRVIGITQTWTLDAVRSIGVDIVYCVMNLLCHLTSTENPMASVCKQRIIDEHKMPLVHHAHAMVQSLHEWCMFQPIYLQTTTPYLKNALAYKQLSLIDRV